MIKGRYVAQIEVDFAYEGQKACYPEIHDRLHGEWIDKAIREAVGEIFYGSVNSITLTKQYVDVTEIKEDESCPKQKLLTG